MASSRNLDGPINSRRVVDSVAYGRVTSNVHSGKFCFIEPDDGGADYFVHKKITSDGKYVGLPPADTRVRFRVHMEKGQWQAEDCEWGVDVLLPDNQAPADAWQYDPRQAYDPSQPLSNDAPYQQQQQPVLLRPLPASSWPANAPPDRQRVASEDLGRKPPFDPLAAALATVKAIEDGLRSKPPVAAERKIVPRGRAGVDRPSDPRRPGSDGNRTRRRRSSSSSSSSSSGSDGKKRRRAAGAGPRRKK